MQQIFFTNIGFSFIGIFTNSAIYSIVDMQCGLSTSTHKTGYYMYMTYIEKCVLFYVTYKRVTWQYN